MHLSLNKSDESVEIFDDYENMEDELNDAKKESDEKIKRSEKNLKNLIIEDDITSININPTSNSNNCAEELNNISINENNISINENNTCSNFKRKYLDNPEGRCKNLAITDGLCAKCFSNKKIKILKMEVTENIGILEEIDYTKINKIEELLNFLFYMISNNYHNLGYKNLKILSDLTNDNLTKACENFFKNKILLLPSFSSPRIRIILILYYFFNNFFFNSFL